jgi:hypothetical protein
MAEIRVRFTTPQEAQAVLPPRMRVSEVVLETDRVVYLQGREIALDIDPALIAWAGPNRAREWAEGEAGEDGERRGRPDNEGKPWTEEEEGRLEQEWDSGITRTAELAELHRRSAGAIRSRLRKLGKVK